MAKKLESIEKVNVVRKEKDEFHLLNETDLVE